MHSSVAIAHTMIERCCGSNAFRSSRPATRVSTGLSRIGGQCCSVAHDHSTSATPRGLQSATRSMSRSRSCARRGSRSVDSRSARRRFSMLARRCSAVTTFTVFIDSASRALVSASTALASFALTSSALSADACEPCTAVTSASIGPPTLSRGTLAAARTSLIL